jgi:hypothetical protein
VKKQNLIRGRRPIDESGLACITGGTSNRLYVGNLSYGTKPIEPVGTNLTPLDSETEVVS